MHRHHVKILMRFLAEYLLSDFMNIAGLAPLERAFGRVSTKIAGLTPRYSAAVTPRRLNRIAEI